MVRLSQRSAKRMFAIHGWSGICLGLLLYTVVMTGMVAVFAHDIGRWSSGAHEVGNPLSQPIDRTIRRLAAETPVKHRETVSLYPTTRNDLGVFFYAHDASANVDRGMVWTVDREGRVISRYEGTSIDVFKPDNDDALERFYTSAHVSLHLPSPWGYLLTGILGLAMLVAAISGLFMHRQLLKDMFTLRLRGNALTAARDRHAIAGIWVLPFAFLVSFTGTFFSFATVIGLPAIATVAFGGSQAAVFELLFEAPRSDEDRRPAELANIDRTFADAFRRTGHYPERVLINRYGRIDSSIMTTHAPREGMLEQVTLTYSGSSGKFAFEKPAIGIRPSVGGMLSGAIEPLHFGNFAGVFSKGVWLALGLASCNVILAGIMLWLRRREAGGRPVAWLDRLALVVGDGLPLALTAAAWGFLVARRFGSAPYWTPTAFVLATICVCFAATIASNGYGLRRLLRFTTGIALILLPAVRMILGGPDWIHALSAGQTLFVSFDLGLSAIGIVILLSASPRSEPSMPRSAPQPRGEGAI